MNTIYFLDTSALAKRYIQETGTAWILSWIEPSADNVIVISELALVEMASILARLETAKKISASRASQLEAVFLLHTDDEYLVTFIDSDTIEQARLLVAKYGRLYGLRTLDAIQLASALAATVTLGEPIVFITGDNKLRDAAIAEGFQTDDPNFHP